MKLKNILHYYIATIVLTTTQLYSQNTNPVVTNVAFSSNGTTVTVTYDVADAEQSTVNINMEVSSNSGVTWNYNYGTASGEIGPGKTTGIGKIITWTYNGGFSEQFKIRIIANDLVVDGGPCADPTLTYSGKTYNTVQIGTQCWLKENLDVGTRIAGSSNQTSGNGIEKYCYNDLDANCTTYGGLYQWNEAMQYVGTQGAQGICPPGWHIPTLAEFVILNTAITNNSNALKAIGQGSGAGAGTNTSGFSSMLAGYRAWYGVYFYQATSYTYYWSSTTEDATMANYPEFNGSGSTIYMNINSKDLGFSVRCLKN